MSDSHMGLTPWNKGLTKATSESVALIGQKKKLGGRVKESASSLHGVARS
jgi:hypothetical protein